LLGIEPETVDIRILSDPYYYPVFKNVNDLNNWPEYGSTEHAETLSKLMNTKSRQIVHNFDTLDNLVNSYLKSETIIRNSTEEELSEKSHLISLHNKINKANEEYFRWKDLEDMKYEKDESSNFVREKSYDLAFRNTEEQTPKASSSKLVDTFADYKKDYDIKIDKLNSESKLETTKLFDSNLRGKLISKENIFTEKKDENVLNKTSRLINEVINDDPLVDNIFVESLTQSKSNFDVKDIPDNFNEAQKEILHDDNKSADTASFLESIKKFGKKKLRTVTEDDLNIYSKTSVDQDKLDKLTGKVVNESEPSIEE